MKYDFIHICYPRHTSWFDYLCKYIPNSKRVYPGEIFDTPKAIFIQNAISYSAKTITDFKKRGMMVIGHHNIEYNQSLMNTFRLYDLMFVGMQSIERDFINHGINAKIMLNAFDPDMSNGLRDMPHINKVLCSGSVILKPGYHHNRLRYITSLVNSNVPVTLRLALEKNGIIDMAKRALTSREVYIKYPKNVIKNNMAPLTGRSILQEIKSHPIVFNCHVDLATEAANMRMIEVCGIGSLLLTDYHSNMDSLFGDSVLTYSCEDELIDKATWAYNNKHEARKLAIKAQKIVLKHHTVEERSKQFVREIN